MNWYKISQSVADEFPVVTLYHGSLSQNKDSILQEGIRSKKVDSETIIENGINFLIKEMELSNDQAEELRNSYAVKSAIDRLERSGFNKVYLTGELSYAISNAAACTEWMEALYDAAERIKYQEFYDKRYAFHGMEQSLYDQIKANDKALQEAYNQLHSGANVRNNIEQLYRKNKQIQKEIDKLSTQYNVEIKPQLVHIKAAAKTLLAKIFGNTTVIFTIKMPYTTFRSKAASDSTKERIDNFEEMYRQYRSNPQHVRNWFAFWNAPGKKTENVWHFFQEVHLTFVEPEYIVDHKEMVDPKFETIS